MSIPRVEVFTSAVDRYGNSYTAVRVETGDKKSEGMVSGDASNVRMALYKIFGGHDKAREKCVLTETKLKIREFDRLTKKWGYAGCTDDLTVFIRHALEAST